MLPKPIVKKIVVTVDGTVVTDTVGGYTILSYAPDVIINAPAGHDTIRLYEEDNTVIAGNFTTVDASHGPSAYVVAGFGSTGIFGKGVNTGVFGDASSAFLKSDGDDFILMGRQGIVHAENATGGNHLAFLGDQGVLNGGAGDDTLGLLTVDSVVSFKNFGVGDSIFLGNLGKTSIADFGITVDPVHDIVRFDYLNGSQPASVTVHTNAASIFSQQGMDQVLALGEIRLT